MEAHLEAMVKSLVAVAWADGRMDDEEHEVLEALVSAFGLSTADAEAVREFAASPRTLQDVPLTELSADDRRNLLQHAVIVTYVDGAQTEDERALLEGLVEKLRIPADEAHAIMETADRRAKRLVSLL